MCGGAYRNLPTLYQMLSIQPPLPQDWGFTAPTENCNMKFRANDCWYRNNMQPPLKTAIWLSDKIVGRFAHLHIYCRQQKYSAEKCFLASFMGVNWQLCLKVLSKFVVECWPKRDSRRCCQVHALHTGAAAQGSA